MNIYRTGTMRCQISWERHAPLLPFQIEFCAHALELDVLLALLCLDFPTPPGTAIVAEVGWGWTVREGEFGPTLELRRQGDFCLIWFVSTRDPAEFEPFSISALTWKDLLSATNSSKSLHAFLEQQIGQNVKATLAKTTEELHALDRLREQHQVAWGALGAFLEKLPRYWVFGNM